MAETFQYFTDSNGTLWSLAANPDGSLTTTIVSGSTTIPPVGIFTLTAGDIISSVIQDAQILTTNRGAILDYVGRVCQRILRDTQWVFLKSQPQKFITQPGSTDYNIGSTSIAGAVNTGLGLSNVWSVLQDSVFDITHNTQLYMDPRATLVRSSLVQKDGSWRPGIPRTYHHEILNPNIISIYPASDNSNSYQPVPVSPVCLATPGATLPNRTYYVAATFVDDLGNESKVSAFPTVTFIPEGFLLQAASPSPEIASAQQVNYAHWNCYVGTSATSMMLQNASPIAVGTAFSEPTTGQIPGPNGPTNNNLTPLSGYVIEFRYFQTRLPIVSPADVLQIPAIYKDVVIAGVNYYVSLYMNKGDDREKAGIWKQEFLEGIRQIRKDLNISFRNTDFIGPDPQTQYRVANSYGMALYS